MILGSVQSCYIPWRGYFDIIRKSDLFVFYDDVQYTKRNWRNRNLIKGDAAPIWLTVPLRRETTQGPIDEVTINNARDWGRKHWRQIEANYRQAPYFRDFGPAFRDILLAKWENLSALNIRLIREACEMLGIRTPFMISRSLNLPGRKTDRMVAMCRAVGATRFLSGPAARAYIEPEKLVEAGVELKYMSYDYPEYPQLFGKFRDYLSIVDLICNCGAGGIAYLEKGPCKPPLETVGSC